jgi:hypothetical protein
MRSSITIIDPGFLRVSSSLAQLSREPGFIFIPIMEQRIRDMIALIQDGNYDQEQTHSDYDALCEDFILHYDEDLLPLMKKLIDLEKNFWWA